MKELENRANVLVRRFNDKYIVIYEDHRFILNVLHYARNKKIISDDVNLVRFDRHGDYVGVSPAALEKIKTFHRSPPDMRKFWDFVEFDINHSDDDWVKVAFELDYIKNSILFNAKEHADSEPEEYKNTVNDNIHLLFDAGFLNDSFCRQGTLYDKHEWPNREFDWFDVETGKFIHPEENSLPKVPYILDFDLDAFAVKTDLGTFSYPYEILLKSFDNKIAFSEEILGKGATPAQFIKKFIKNAEFITICIESTYCGGISNAYRILSVIDHHFFDGVICK